MSFYVLAAAGLAADFPNFGPFDEVWASDLTKCEAENSQIVVLGAFSLATGEMFGSNLTKCPKIDCSC